MVPRRVKAVRTFELQRARYRCVEATIALVGCPAPDIVHLEIDGLGESRSVECTGT